MKPLFLLTLPLIAEIIKGDKPTPPPPPRRPTLKDVFSIGGGLINIIIGNQSNMRPDEPKTSLVKVENTLVDLDKVVGATFAPETSRQVATLHIIFYGGGELTLQGATAVTLWQKLAASGEHLAKG